MCNAEGGSCNASGSCVCEDGWSGVKCDVAVCSPECVPGNEQCVAPNNCSCDPGWTGSQCETCILADGCCELFSSMHNLFCQYYRDTRDLVNTGAGVSGLANTCTCTLHIGLEVQHILLMLQTLPNSSHSFLEMA